MPNMNHLRHPLKIKGLIAKQLGEGSVDRFLWRVPIENDRCLGLGVDIVHLEGEDGAKKFSSAPRKQSRPARAMSNWVKGFSTARQG